VRKIVEAQPDTRFDRCHFLTYGDTALQFEPRFYFMTKSDFALYADTQQAINRRCSTPAKAEGATGRPTGRWCMSNAR